VLPAAAIFDGFAPPHPGGAVEVEKGTRAIARCLFDNEMAIEQHFLNARQQ
jgi:hypothetical protein